MYFQCKECETVLETNEPPFICTTCGLAGVGFREVAEPEGRTVEEHVYFLEPEDDLTLDFEIRPR